MGLYTLYWLIKGGDISLVSLTSETGLRDNNKVINLEYGVRDNNKVINLDSADNNKIIKVGVITTDILETTSIDMSD
ncbi:hypothetical protein [Epinotia aporema granulovirus]|uniref:Uncharacterized protein n=1 Tax=Epinotia aporema granulovirus TaxID=166056 RepID=K4ER53_9BBAC|nr:hypothetical protein [Epinotia aporema granulovirus]AER41444.1 hypothetical protein [Epinotia aporema granulovirus]